jgi:cytochrome c5
MTDARRGNLLPRAGKFREALLVVVLALACGAASGLWSLNARGDDGSSSSSSGSTANPIAFHDRNSGRYNDNCLSCHSGVLTEVPVVTNATGTNPNLNAQPRTRTAHGTMLQRNNKPGRAGDDRQCQFCHRSVNIVEGPPMPQDAMKGAIRKRVDPAVCTLCHGPQLGGQPNSPGPQFYRLGLSQLVDLSNPLAAGQRLYGLYCAGCHDPLPNSQVRGESASEIRGKINENEGGMGPLRVLTPAQIEAIATALR